MEIRATLFRSLIIGIRASSDGCETRVYIHKLLERMDAEKRL